MRLSVTIMAHPRRSLFVDELVEQLPDAEVVWDERNDRWDTGSRALLTFDPSADGHLVIQDDVILGRDLVPGATAAFAATDGTRPVALYTGKVKPHRNTVTPAVRRARRLGIPWLAMDGPWWGPGLVIPTAQIPDLVAYGTRRHEIKNYDRRIEAFYKSQGIDCWYTIPSLVDHRPVAENPSLISGRIGNRQAHYFIGDDSPLDIDWNIPPLRIDDPVTYRHAETNRVRTVKTGTAAARSMARNPNWIEEAPNADVQVAA